jgi:hypothetical protein
MHSVLHDWTDENALDILGNLKPAFKKGYSKLLLNAVVVPAGVARPITSALDLIMMSGLSSRERSAEDWENLLGAAGFRIVKIWSGTSSFKFQSLIEAELA